ncbi:ribosomal protein S18-alanine N-acetyltransferase [Kocuria sp.]|uniref:ribosomal protein S18-alanine N-acetyltransferase n=1 Tax=Kocuria sp. TaxID=1871328 RepID=UPI0026E0E7CE|nr:ribosomal protein S18-alanine N-acetyltransferase [Kocuria sp.]MDO5617338.1 ribosomal protein S18-alanine N-acetyltransferase [Kocuria sp.]
MKPGAPEWNLRAATVADVATIETLEQQLFPEDAWSLEMILSEITHPTRSYWVAEAHGQVMGYAGVMVVADTADVQNIAVAPEHEGQGVGTALLTTLHREAKERGAREVLLEVRVDNHRAQALYQRFGYVALTVRPRYYPGGADALIMRAELALATPSTTTDLTSHMGVGSGTETQDTTHDH